MPWNAVMPKWKAGTLKSSSGQPITNQKQAVAVMLSEKRKAEQGDKEYQPAHIKSMRKAMSRGR